MPLLRQPQTAIRDISLTHLCLLEERRCLIDKRINTYRLQQKISELRGHLNVKIGRVESLRLRDQYNIDSTLTPSPIDL